jgi:hypothetical protein
MKVFVVMPFNDKVAENLYRHSIKPVCHKLDLNATRADEIFSPNPILDDIVVAIESAKVIIADITGRNANVFYELGISHTLKRSQTIMITRDPHKDVPFDVGHFRIIKYEDSISGKSVFEHDLEQTLRVILGDPRTLKASEFKHTAKMFTLLDREQELQSIVARRALGISPDIGTFWDYEIQNPIGYRSKISAIYDYSSFRSSQALGYVEFTDKKINFTPAGEAFADFLTQIGYRCSNVKVTSNAHSKKSRHKQRTTKS